MRLEAKSASSVTAGRRVWILSSAKGWWEFQCVHSFYCEGVPFGERKGAGVGIIWHQDATGGAWESPIVLPFSNTLLFHLVGRTTLYTRPVLRSKLAFGGSLCMWNIVEILMNAARLLSHAAVACSTVLKCLNTGCNSKWNRITLLQPKQALITHRSSAWNVCSPFNF